MIFDFVCEICGTHKRVRRGRNQRTPRFCSRSCRVAEKRNAPPIFTREWLHQKYIVEGLGCPEIGKLCDRDGTTIRYWLEKYGIPRRPRGYNRAQNLPSGRPKGWHHSEETKRKVGEASRQRGAVPYLRDGEHFNKGRRGPVVHNWKGGVTPERQTFYRSDEWKATCKAVWTRDNATCRRCGLHKDEATVSFHVHHIVSFANKQLRATPSNLVLLCGPCHYFIHSKANVKREYLDALPTEVTS